MITAIVGGGLGLLGGLLAVVGVVGQDDLLHQMMADHVLLREVVDGDVVDPLQDLDGGGQTRALAVGQVGLGQVARHHHLGAEAQAGEEHLDLLGGGVLRLVQDDEGVIQRTAPHVGQGGYLNDALLHQLLMGLGTQHLTQGVVEGAEVGVDLAEQVAWEEAQPLARLDGGASEQDAGDLLLLEGLDRHGHGQEGLTRTCGSHAQDDGILTDGLHVPGLACGLGLNGLSLGGDEDAVRANVGQLSSVTRGDHIHHVAHRLVGDLGGVAHHVAEVFHHGGGAVDVVQALTAHHDGVRAVLPRLIA